MNNHNLATSAASVLGPPSKSSNFPPELNVDEPTEVCVAAADLADLIRAKKGFPCWTEGECNPSLPPLLTLRRRHMGEAKCEAEQSAGRGDQGRKRNTGKEL